jgi:hypothetical protein
VRTRNESAPTVISAIAQVGPVAQARRRDPLEILRAADNDQPAMHLALDSAQRAVAQADNAPPAHLL